MTYTYRIKMAHEQQLTSEIRSRTKYLSGNIMVLV